MSKNSKRLRQISLIESFGFSKKLKTEKSSHIDMDKQNHTRELMAAAAEKRISLASMKTDIKVGDSSLNGQAKSEDSIFADSSSSELSQTHDLQVSDHDENSLPSSYELFSETEGLTNSSTINSIDSPSISNFSHSAELFSDSNNQEAETLSSDDEEQVQLSFLNRSPECNLPLPNLEPLENHIIMFSPHIRDGDAPRPYPNTYRDKWDSDHIRMPCSPQNRYPVESLNGGKQIQSRWDVICRSLRRNIECSLDLENAIMKYNSQYIGRWNFKGLHTFFNVCLSAAERSHFFETVLPVMIDMALNLPYICTQPVPLLKKDTDHSVTMSQKQIGCLLLNAFFCTFPRRTLPGRYKKERWNCEYATYPDINFNRLFYGTKDNVPSKNTEKLKCLINYFRRITAKEPCGTVTFHRQCLQDLPKWEKSTCRIRTVVIKGDGLIETDGCGMLQVDFANKFVGGGVLGQGCVQEEIRFVICPELIVSRLFVECLDFNEVLIVTGVEQYNKYSGYSDGFKWEGNFDDRTPRDAWGRRCTQVVAMDAKHFRNPAEQFKEMYITRELNKAFCGFYENALPENLPAVATGNWGCGAFNGNPSLKFLIQLMAASQAGRSMLYFTFGNENLKKELKNIYHFVKGKSLSVGDLWRLLIIYCATVNVLGKELHPTLGNFLRSTSLSEHKNNIEAVTNENLQNDSEEKAMQKLIEDVCNDDSNTETEDNDFCIQ
ncbi:poly(ADP-ribose) glycohydrolase-like isoform X2 [Stegodyphus dumicola]|uniref:poly(ADP-ribose) glycohydrolase-like isoform X2 n=1 Tax=Stegodyphus dumicola TaxID=202533 RepID=UPI0015ADEDA7|nr:poly(ADP-ribose) glycohydrolase-like isoform X2 [Stegodyphus dumicola]